MVMRSVHWGLRDFLSIKSDTMQPEFQRFFPPHTCQGPRSGTPVPSDIKTTWNELQRCCQVPAGDIIARSGYGFLISGFQLRLKVTRNPLIKF